MANVLEIRSDGGFTADLAFSDDAGAIDLTGFTVTANIRHSRGSVACTVAYLDRAAGTVRISLTATQTGLLPHGRVSTLRITYASGSGEPDWDEVSVEVK